METLSQQTEISEDSAKGCIFGALCGDAIGAFLEFKAIITSKDVETAFTLPGGGHHKIGKGQITDDSELLLCLAHGLAESKGVLNLNKIAEYYGKWVKSCPFDIGATTRNALPKAVDMKTHQARLVRLGAQNSLSSQSNGSLMRMTPLCIWTSRLSKDDLIRAITEETKLTHPNQSAIDVNIAYAFTIQHLLQNKGDYQGAYQKCKEILEYIKSKEVKVWIQELEMNELPAVNKKSGWAKIAFIYAMYYLKNNFGYVDALKDILSKKGDTDTNCCIIGGLLGALHGYDKLPKDIVEKVLKFDPSKNSGVKRPDFLVPGKCVKNLIEVILATAPKTLPMIGEETEEEKIRNQEKVKKVP